MHKININIASIYRRELTTLRRIGLKKAAAIVAYRTRHGLFASVDELTKVKGISPRIVAANRVRLHVSTPKEK